MDRRLSERFSDALFRARFQGTTGTRRGSGEGKAEGLAAGKAEGILAVLAARDLAVSPEQQARVLTCTDLGTLDRWLRAAAVCAEAAALFRH